VAKCISFCDACGYEFSKDLLDGERWMPLYCDECCQEREISYIKPTLGQEILWTATYLFICILVLVTLVETVEWLKGMK